MKDIPMFTTENGAAALILREIPYSGAAYIRVYASESLDQLLYECVSFCRMCAAERIYATGHPDLERYPLHTAIWKMTCPKEDLPDTDACLFPVQEKTLEEFRTLYNARMSDVPNAACMTAADGKQMLAQGDGYFVHRHGELLGIGRASGHVIDAVVSAQPGAGETVVAALAHTVGEDVVTLEVASANDRAVRLYERMGFVKAAERSRWFCVG